MMPSAQLPTHSAVSGVMAAPIYQVSPLMGTPQPFQILKMDRARGSIVVRHTRCGKANCRCKADPPELHGPYISWTRKVAGKTVTRVLSPDQLERYQHGFDNARRLRELIAELETLSLHATEQQEGWPPQT